VDGCKKKRVEQRNYCQERKICPKFDVEPSSFSDGYRSDKCQDPECQRVVEDSFELCSHRKYLIYLDRPPRRRVWQCLG